MYYHDNIILYFFFILNLSKVFTHFKVSNIYKIKLFFIKISSPSKILKLYTNKSFPPFFFIFISYFNGFNGLNSPNDIISPLGAKSIYLPIFSYRIIPGVFPFTLPTILALFKFLANSFAFLKY